MDNYSENNPMIVKPGSLQGLPVEGGKFAAAMRNNRRALRDIRNFVGAPPPHRATVSKRRLPDKSSVDDENQQFAGHRPMTRKFAASLADRQFSHQDMSRRNDKIENEKPKKAILPVQSSDNLENIAVIDVEEYMETSDFPLPDYVKQTEEMLEDMEAMDDCEVEEVEMEDLEVLDIDSCDSKNPLAVVDYVEDIYAYYRNSETSGCVCPNYMSNQLVINERMRAILIDWLIEVHYKLELMDETLFLTVNLIDRFLERQLVVRKKLQLVGVTALLLACKYEEVSVPVLEDLVLISDRAYTRDEVLGMERLMINTLQFNLSVPTPYVFMRRFLKAAESDKKLKLLSFFMIELCLVEHEMLKFRPSLLAASAIYAAQSTLKGSRHWSKTSEVYTGYSEDQLLECSMLMMDFHQKAPTGKLTGAHRKYSTSKFGFAAKIGPAHFILGSSTKF